MSIIRYLSLNILGSISLILVIYSTALSLDVTKYRIVSIELESNELKVNSELPLNNNYTWDDVIRSCRYLIDDAELILSDSAVSQESVVCQMDSKTYFQFHMSDPKKVICNIECMSNVYNSKTLTAFSL